MEGKPEKLCKMCGREGTIKKAHIYSEFFYKPLYNSRHKLISFEEGKGRGFKRKVKQKGYYEDGILGLGCEKILNKAETYASKVLFVEGFAKKNVYKNPDSLFHLVRYENVNADLLKMSWLANLYRASIAEGEYFSQFKIDPEEEIVKDILLGNEPLSSCPLSLFIVRERQIQPVIRPKTMSFDKAKVYILTIAGFSVSFFPFSTQIPEFFRTARAFPSESQFQYGLTEDSEMAKSLMQLGL